MIGYAETLSAYCAAMSDQDLHKNLETVSRVGHKIDNIIDELLLLASVRQMDVASEPLDMAGIVTGAMQRLVDMIEDHRAEIIVPEYLRGRYL